MKTLKFETLALHAGQIIDSDTNSRGVPLYRTSAYMFNSAEHARKLFSLEEQGNIYSRLGNPTQDVLEKRVAALEGGQAALALASGTSAIFYTILNLCRQGDEIISAGNLYGGTYTMFSSILPDYGIKVKFFNVEDIDSIERLVTEKTRGIYIESIGNPGLEIPDFEKISKIAKKNRLPLIVDSTFTTPYLFRPLEHGADIVIHSLTKWIGGHGTAIGGIVVDGGKFDWKNDKFENFNQPDSGYHGMRFAHDLGDANSLAFIIRMRIVPLRNLGACISPDNAWIFLQGIETLSLRMERHCENALKVARYLEKHEKISWVNYPGLADCASHANAVKYLKSGYGGMISFGVKGGRKAGENFINSIKLISHLANVGDAKSLAIHPASTTHSQLSADELKFAGITEDMIRLSVGIENVDDILNDIDTALEETRHADKYSR